MKSVVRIQRDGKVKDESPTVLGRCRRPAMWIVPWP